MCTACSGVTESALVARSENRCGLLRPVSQCRYRYLPRSRLRFPVFYTLKINVCGAITVLAKNVWFNANRRSCRRQFLTASFLGSAVQVKKKKCTLQGKTNLSSHAITMSKWGDTEHTRVCCHRWRPWGRNAQHHIYGDFSLASYSTLQSPNCFLISLKGTICTQMWL